MIHEYDTTGSLSDRLMKKGASLVLKTVDLIATGEYQLIPQDLSVDAPKAPKLFKENCQINWDQSSRNIVNFIRGLNPFPSAWTTIAGTVYKIHAAQVVENKVLSGSIGNHETDGNSYLYFKCRDGAVSITEIQAPGKRKMPIVEFLRGNRL